ncbi:MAG TPA: DUF1566 domain-containing protein [Polyangiaceae bacterium]|nr:DUF1566 domain-containing protein [Polyangiaceae bacterium]
MDKRLSGFLVGAVLTVGLYSIHSGGAAPAGRYMLTATTVYDTKTKLTWQRQSSFDRFAWVDAQTYCPKASGGTWRMPTYKELFTIVDTASTTNPLLDPAFEFDKANTFTGFWSSTSLNADTSMTISFAPSGGSSVTTHNAGDMYSVRCVF